MSKLKLLLLASTYVASAWAQNDPPTRTARLNLINGVVSFQPAGVVAWEAAPLNRPLIAGDRLWSEPGARAEFHVGSTVVRMSQATSFHFSVLDDRMLQGEVVQGSIIVRLREVFDDETYEILTPQLSFQLLRAGEYRIDVTPDGNATILTTRSGLGEAAGGGRTFEVRPRMQSRVTGLRNLEFEVRDNPGNDGFDNWAHERDIREDRSESARFVGRGVIGYEDLDDNGGWIVDAEYGRVWVPRTVPAGWAPYRFGHWAYIQPWGWTWIDDAPWGFAPFHYGRWVTVGAGWAWIPGPVVPRPVYAPAMVAWVGGPPRAGVAVSVGWFPLGPREVYVPAHGASAAYVNRVNVTNTTVTNIQVTNVYKSTTVINQTYVNQQHTTVINQSDMASGRRVQQVRATVAPEAIRSMQVTHTVSVAPVRAATPPPAARQAAAPPAALMDRRPAARPTAAAPAARRAADAPVAAPAPAARRAADVPVQAEHPRPAAVEAPVVRERPVAAPAPRPEVRREERTAERPAAHDEKRKNEEKKKKEVKKREERKEQ